MDKNDFKISGYAKFYRSMLRFFHSLDSAYALKLTYSLYTAVLDSYRAVNPEDEVKEKGEVEFFRRIKQIETKPYLTEIQLYRAMEAIVYTVNVTKIRTDCIQAIIEITRVMDDIELRFYKSFDMEIDDDRTVYYECARSLVSNANEPSVCLKQDLA